MIPEDFNYEETYAATEDDELLEIARDSVDLVDAAKTALAKELEKRGLKVEPEQGKAARESGNA
jgi:phosphosulfolactate synthase (CoM biosynthesis protein A)